MITPIKAIILDEDGYETSQEVKIVQFVMSVDKITYAVCLADYCKFYLF